MVYYCHLYRPASNLSNLKSYGINNYRVIENHIEPEYSYLNVELSIIEISVIWFVADYIMFCESQRIGSILEQVLSLYVYLSTLMDHATFYYLLIFLLPGTTPCRSSLPQANEANYIAKAMEKTGPLSLHTPLPAVCYTNCRFEKVMVHENDLDTYIYLTIIYLEEERNDV